MLDGYRGAAAVAVLLFHATAKQSPWIAAHGYLAVDFFFCLSGFIVASAYEARLKGSLGPATFMLLRVQRLYPLVAVGAILGATLLPSHYPVPGLVPPLISGLLLLPVPLGSQLPLIAANPVSWSLLLELAANLLYALCLPWLTTARLCLLTYASFFLLAVMALGYGNLDVGALWSNAMGGPPRVIFSFFAGVTIHRARVSGWLRGRGLPPTVGLPLLMLILMLPHQGAWMPLIDLLSVGLIFPAIVAGGIDSEPGRWQKACALAGALSYPAYILQGGLYPVIAAAPGEWGLAGLAATAASFGLVATYLGFAWTILKLIDQPIQRRFRARIRGYGIARTGIA